MTTTPTASPELLDLETLRKIGILITTQDNRITDQPMFIVQQRRRMYGLDTGYCDNFIWLCSEDEYNEASAEEADALEAEYQDTGRAKDGWQRTGYIDQWEFVTACFTEQGCIDYLKLDGHNLNEPRIYAEGSYRNEEFRAVRNSLIALARRAQPEGEAPQADPEQPNGGMHDSIFVKVWGDAGGGDAGRRKLAEYAYALGKRASATLPPLCGAQHAESGKEVAVFANDGSEPNWSIYAAAEAVQQAAAPGALAIEAAKLAPILRGMCEGGDVHGDGVDIYADGYIAGDGDTYVVRAAALLEQIAATSAPGIPEAPKPPFPISDDEMAALRRFWECATDDEGYDVSKRMMQRLADMGLVQRKSGSYYMSTDFGLYVLGEYTIDSTAQLDGGQEGSESNG